MPTTGVITDITRYPVKSMRGEALDEITIGLRGLPGDRNYAFVKDGALTPFNWLTGRDWAGLLRCQPSWDRSGQNPQLMVSVEGDGPEPIESDDLRDRVAREAGRPVFLHRDHRGTHDIAYVSIITLATIRALSREGGVPVDHRRFRMNLVVDVGDEPFQENRWVGRSVTAGEARLAATDLDRRCVMITLDPDTGLAAPAVLKAAGTLNDVYAGIYATVLVAGRVSVGDTLIVAD